MTARSALFRLQARRANAQAALKSRDLRSLQDRAYQAGQMQDRIAALLDGLGTTHGAQSMTELRDRARLGATLQAERDRQAQHQQLLHQQIAQVRVALDALLRGGQQARDAALHHQRAEASERDAKLEAHLQARRLTQP